MLVRVHCLLGWHEIVVGFTSTQLFMLQGNLIILGLRCRLLLGQCIIGITLVQIQSFSRSNEFISCSSEV